MLFFEKLNQITIFRFVEPRGTPETDLYGQRKLHLNRLDGPIVSCDSGSCLLYRFR